MSDGGKIYLCRMFSKEHPCIGHTCGYLTRDGTCLIAGENPPSRWTGKARVIAVTQEQLSTGDVEYGFTGMHDCDYGMTHAPTEAHGRTEIANV